MPPVPFKKILSALPYSSPVNKHLFILIFHKTLRLGEVKILLR